MDTRKNVKLTLSHAFNNLTKEQFKWFKWRLSDTDYDGKETIPRGQLETDDIPDVVDLMCGHYGEDGALKVCIRVLKEINARDVAEKLEDATQRDFGSHQVPAISDYRNHIKTNFQIVKDPNSHLGEYVHLNQRYSKLIIIDYQRPEEERKNEIMASGWGHEEIMEKRDNSSITIEELFRPDEYDLIPKVIVLQGATGVGKTMTARRIMFDWACGHLFQDMFDFAFYIHCSEMNLSTDEKTIMEIILKQWPNQHAVQNAANELVKEILRNPQKLLFIIDGFDELRFSLDQPEGHLCTDLQQKEPVGVLLSSLFRKKVLPESYLIVTTRPTALEKLSGFLECPRYAEILGFSVQDREVYFHKFFGKKDQAIQAFELVRQNKTLFTMCVVPLVCWIICTVMKQQMDSGEDLRQTSNTLTAVYMLYLSSLFKRHSQANQHMQTILKKLCSLAVDGIWRKEILFGEEEIKNYNLDQEKSLPLFLNENIFKRDLDCVCTYSFIHFSFQEFFAALYYALEGDVPQSSQTPNPDVRTLLETYKTSRFDLEVTVRFLFGLLNESKRMKELKETLGLKISPKLKKVLVKWVKSRTDKMTKIEMEILQNLYENQDEHFIKCALDITTLIIVPTNEMEVIAVAYCLERCHSLEYLCFYAWRTGAFCGSLAKIICQNQRLKYLDWVKSEIKGTEIKLLCERLKQPDCKVEQLCLVECNLTGACYEDLAQVLSENQRLKVLSLSYNEIKDTGVKLLCESLNNPVCRLEKLGLTHCHLTEACSGDLAHVLSGNRSLKELHLSSNKIEDKGMKVLCIGLKHPNCKLKKLRVSLCNLTADCCGDLAQVLRKSQSLKELNLSDNEIQNTGLKLLCESLKHPDCKLEKLWLVRCHLTGACCEDLAQVLSRNQRLKKLDLSSNKIDDKGMKVLCTALKHPNCKLKMLSVSRCSLTAACCGDLVQVFKESRSLKELNLSHNEVKDTGVKLLYEVLKHPDCKLEKLWVSKKYVSNGGDKTDKDVKQQCNLL